MHIYSGVNCFWRAQNRQVYHHSVECNIQSSVLRSDSIILKGKEEWHAKGMITNGGNLYLNDISHWGLAAAQTSYTCNIPSCTIHIIKFSNAWQPVVDRFFFYPLSRRLFCLLCLKELYKVHLSRLTFSLVILINIKARVTLAWQLTTSTFGQQGTWEGDSKGK